MVYNGLWRFLRISPTGNIPVLWHSLHVPSLYIEGCMGAAVQRRGADGESRSNVCHHSEPRLSTDVTWRSCAAARVTSLFIISILESLQSQSPISQLFSLNYQRTTCQTLTIKMSATKISCLQKEGRNLLANCVTVGFRFKSMQQWPCYRHHNTGYQEFFILSKFCRK